MKPADAIATHSATPDAREPHGPERLHHPAARDKRDVDQQRRTRECSSPEYLSRRVEGELALEDAGAGPGHRG